MVELLQIFLDLSYSFHIQPELSCSPEQCVCRNRVHAIFLRPSRSMFNEGDEQSEKRI